MNTEAMLHNAGTLLLTAGVSLVFLFLVFRPLEVVFPAKPGQRVLRRGWLTDLCFFFGQYLLWNGAVLWLLNLGADWLDATIPGTFRAAVAAQPWWLQAVEVVVLSDLFVYWGHRLQHNVGWLWKFHAIHHSAEHMDWLAAHREHPVDTVYTVGLINLPVFLLGFPLETLAWLVAFRGLWAVFIHSNVSLPLGWLGMVVGSPRAHHWHHDMDRHAGNYANISPLMDIIFGTYHCPDHEPERVGIGEPIASGYVGQLLHPFRRSGARRGQINEHRPGAGEAAGRRESSVVVAEPAGEQ